MRRIGGWKFFSSAVALLLVLTGPGVFSQEEAAGKYAVVHVGKENHILRETMSSLESHLPRQRFLRISRSVIVNMDQIKELQPMFKGENLVVLKNGKSYPTTRPIREIQQKLVFR